MLRPWPGLVVSPYPPPPETPATALRALLEGNRRFVLGHPRGPNRSLEKVAALAEAQRPWAAILGCADSRVPLEILFDAGFGDLFVVRVAGNVAASEQIGSLEYAVSVLGTPLVMVLGHSGCGAVTAALSESPAPGRIPALLRHIEASIPVGCKDIEQAIELNVRHQLRQLGDQSALLREQVEQGSLALLGAVVDLSTGQVRLLDGASRSGT
jgi:carbonic anhydrase